MSFTNETSEICPFFQTTFCCLALKALLVVFGSPANSWSNPRFGSKTVGTGGCTDRRGELFWVAAIQRRATWTPERMKRPWNSQMCTKWTHRCPNHSYNMVGFFFHTCIIIQMYSRFCAMLLSVQLLYTIRSWFHGFSWCSTCSNGKPRMSKGGIRAALNRKKLKALDAEAFRLKTRGDPWPTDQQMWLLGTTLLKTRICCCWNAHVGTSPISQKNSSQNNISNFKPKKRNKKH